MLINKHMKLKKRNTITDPNPHDHVSMLGFPALKSRWRKARTHTRRSQSNLGLMVIVTRKHMSNLVMSILYHGMRNS